MTQDHQSDVDVATEAKVDIWRDTPVRLLGYANETGEAFRHIFPRMVGPSYALAIGYSLCDVADKGYLTYKRDQGFSKLVFAHSFDCFIWQMAASVFIPGAFINQVVSLSQKMIPNCTSGNRRFIPVFIGLATIPFIVHPIDSFTTWALEKTLRKYY